MVMSMKGVTSSLGLIAKTITRNEIAFSNFGKAVTEAAIAIESAQQWAMSQERLANKMKVNVILLKRKTYDIDKEFNKFCYKPHGKTHRGFSYTIKQ